MAQVRAWQSWASWRRSQTRTPTAKKGKDKDVFGAYDINMYIDKNCKDIDESNFIYLVVVLSHPYLYFILAGQGTLWISGVS